MKKIIEELFIKIEEQRKELDQRGITLSAIQRNFESLSNICKTEKQYNIELQKKNNYFQDENNKLNSNILSLQER